MIHYGDYYKIADKDKILSLVDEIEQNITRMCHQYLIQDNKMLKRYLVQDPKTPTYMDALPGRKISHVRRPKGQNEDSTEVLSLGRIKWNIEDVAS